jgi:peptide/nickel transport system substrate-binding protein
LRAGSRSVWLSGVIALSLIAAACGGSDDDGSSGAAAAGDTATESSASSDATGGGSGAASRVIVGSANEPETLDVMQVDSGPKDLAVWSINEGLVWFDRDGGLIPQLAAELPTNLPEDRTKWQVKLRDGITFTNGEPVNAEAVKANIERVMDETYASELISEFGTMSGAEVVDELTVNIITSAPDPVFDRRLTFLRLMPPVAMLEADYGQNPIGTGPYVLGTWDRGRSMTLTRNPDYWGEPATVDEVEIRYIPDDGTRLAALQAGEIDIAENIAPDQVDDVPQVLASATVVQSSFIRLNLNKPPFDDANFRRALNYAVNKEALNDNLFAGQFPPNNCQAVGPQSGGFNPDLSPYPYDPDKAKELLADVEIPDGFELTLSGSSPGLVPRENELIQAVAADITAVGIPVKIELDALPEFYDKLFLDAAHGSDGGDAGSGAADALYIPSDNAWNHVLRHLTIYINRDGEVSVTGAAYPELDAMLEEATTEFDPEKSTEALNAVTKLECDEAFMIFLEDRYNQWGASDRVDYEPGFGVVTHMDFGRLKLTS